MCQNSCPSSYGYCAVKASCEFFLGSTYIFLKGNYFLYIIPYSLTVCLLDKFHYFILLFPFMVHSNGVRIVTKMCFLDIFSHLPETFCRSAHTIEAEIQQVALKEQQITRYGVLDHCHHIELACFLVVVTQLTPPVQCWKQTAKNKPPPNSGSGISLSENH